MMVKVIFRLEGMQVRIYSLEEVASDKLMVTTRNVSETYFQGKSTV